MREAVGNERGDLTLETLVAQGEQLDRAALETPDIDAFCSSTAWIVPALRAFQPATHPLILRSEQGFVALTQIADWQGRYLVPFEASWCLGCPLLGREAEPLVRMLWERIGTTQGEWDVLLLTGLTPSNPLWRQILRFFSRACSVYPGPTAVRRIIQLEGDFEKYLERRSAKFRKNLRQALKRARHEGFCFQRVSGVFSSAMAETWFQRFLEIESLSWKGIAHQGINENAMCQFYREMFHLIGPLGGLRAILVTRGEQDVGYLFGAVFGRSFRGLQFSFDQTFREFEPGNLMQYHMLEWMASEGLEGYDLGMDMPYKQRWSDRALETSALAIRRR